MEIGRRTGAESGPKTVRPAIVIAMRVENQKVALVVGWAKVAMFAVCVVAAGSPPMLSAISPSGVHRRGDASASGNTAGQAPLVVG